MKRREALFALAAAASVVLARLTVFAIQLSNTQAKSRRDVEARVHERAVLAAALIDGLFQSIEQQIPQYAALREIKADDSLRRIPVVVLTTSKDEEDIVRSYDLGVSSFISKPVTFAGLVEAMRTWSRYWFELVELPNHHSDNGERR